MIQKQLKKQQELEKVTTKESGNRSKIGQIQQELDLMTQNIAQLSQSVSTHGEEFQMKKIDDLRGLLNELLYSEMEFHARGTFRDETKTF